MPLPRRHRRRLLLPPGLLALAWLLWLGCVALPQSWGMRPQHVIEINFPALNPNINMLADIPYSSPATIAAFRPWQTFVLNGNLFEDYFALRNAQAVFRRLETDPNHDRGLQVKLGRQASYISLIQLLDWCNVYNMKRYWIDIHHEPTTLYVFTTKPDPTYKKTPYWSCGTNYNIVPIMPPQPTSWLGPVAPLLAPDWRTAMLLLLLLGAVSAYRLGRGWWAR